MSVSMMVLTLPLWCDWIVQYRSTIKEPAFDQGITENAMFDTVFYDRLAFVAHLLWQLRWDSRVDELIGLVGNGGRRFVNGRDATNVVWWKYAPG